jgi:hypothetical protein
MVQTGREAKVLNWKRMPAFASALAGRGRLEDQKEDNPRARLGTRGLEVRDTFSYTFSAISAV